MTIIGKSFVFAAALALTGTGAAGAQETQQVPLPGYLATKDLPGAHELPDPKLTYKILFSVNKGSEDVDKVDPGLAQVADYVDTLAKYGVGASHRKLAVILSGKSTPLILKDDAFMAQSNGHHNPNLALIDALKKAGVEVRVCGQAVLGHKIALPDVNPDVMVDLSAAYTVANYQLRGYIHMGP